MKEKLKQYLDGIFSEAPDTQQNQELKDEFYANLCDRYDEAVAEGKSENDAYMISLRSLGDVHDLLGIKDEEPVHAKTVAPVKQPAPAAADKQRENEENRRREEQKKQRDYVKRPVFLFILVAYFIVSFVTSAWYITWLLFIVDLFVNMVIDGIFEYKEGRRKQ